MTRAMYIDVLFSDLGAQAVMMSATDIRPRFRYVLIKSLIFAPVNLNQILRKANLIKKYISILAYKG